MGELNAINSSFYLENSADGRSGSSLLSLTRQNKILVVDDDQLSRMLIERLLEREFDMDIVTLANGLEGLEYVRLHRPRLVVLDLMLPGMNGFNVLKEIRKNPQLKQTKVVLVSAKARSEDIEAGFDLSADEYITKPFKPREFTARLKKLLTRAA